MPLLHLDDETITVSRKFIISTHSTVDTRIPLRDLPCSFALCWYYDPNYTKDSEEEGCGCCIFLHCNQLFYDRKLSCYASQLKSTERASDRRSERIELRPQYLSQSVSQSVDRWCSGQVLAWIMDMKGSITPGQTKLTTTTTVVTQYGLLKWTTSEPSIS